MRITCFINIIIFTISNFRVIAQTVRVEVGQWIHEGRILLVDNIQVTQRTTSPPTHAPTFAPTKGKETGPTYAPTIRTDSPTTTNVISCPVVGDAPLSIGSGHVMLSIADIATLCTLTKSVTSETSGETILIPIARSYDNKLWEQAAGDLAVSIIDNKEILCYSVGCQLDLPPLRTGESYLLSSSSHSLTESDEYARFLESATFGITQIDIDSLLASPKSVPDNIIDWVSSQMNVTETPLSSHREYWRKRTNSRVSTSFKFCFISSVTNVNFKINFQAPSSTFIGTPDHPCDQYSRWRKVSFVRNDYMWHVEKKLRIVDLGSGDGPFKLELNRWARTVVDQLEIEDDGYSDYTFDPAYEYELCKYPEDTMINGRLYIRLEPENENEDGPCVIVRNPLVNLDGHESIVSRIINLPEDLLPIDQQWNSGEDLVLQLQSSLHDNPSFSSTCANLPIVPEQGDEPIFGKLSDGTWLIFDPRLDLLSNTPALPEEDGGKAEVIASGGETLCSNVPRTFLNEDQCKVSSNACRPSSNSQVEILLDNNTISALNNLTGRYTYAIMGLLVKYDGIVLDHPCTPDLRSRWLRKEVGECNPTDLYGNTTESLTDLLRNSGDRNPYFRDITFPEEGLICEDRDTEPAIEIMVDGVCWRRVHDEFMSVFDVSVLLLISSKAIPYIYMFIFLTR